LEQARCRPALGSGLGVEGVGLGGGGVGGQVGVLDLAGLDAGVDEEACADAEGDEGAGDSGEDLADAEDGPEDGEEEGDADRGGDQDDAGEADVGAAAEGVGGGTRRLGEGEFGCGGRGNEAFGDGGEALLAFHLAAAGAGPAGDGDDAEDHEAAGDGDDEGTVGCFAEAGHGFDEHGDLLRAAASGAAAMVSVGLRLRERAKVSGARMKLLEEDEVIRQEVGNRK